VKTARSVCYDILREILREARQFNPREFRVVAPPRVVELFLDEESQHLAGLSDFIGKPISLQAESALGPNSTISCCGERLGGLQAVGAGGALTGSLSRGRAPVAQYTQRPCRNAFCL